MNKNFTTTRSVQMNENDNVQCHNTIFEIIVLIGLC